MLPTRTWAGPLLVAAAGATMAILTWGTWPDPLVDFGKELYIAWQLSEGKHLYTDVAYHLGPLSPYLNALAFKLFGSTLLTIELLNLSFIALMIALTYRLIRRTFGEPAATICCLTFVLLFAFGHFTPIADYNFIAPYDHAHTHGILLGLLGLTFADSYNRTRNKWFLAASGATIGLAFLTRAELFLADAAGTITILLLTLSHPSRPSHLSHSPSFTPSPPRPPTPSSPLILLSSILLPLALTLALLGPRALLGSWPIVFDHSIAASPFYRDSMGTLNTSTSLLKIAIWAAIWIAVFLPPCAFPNIEGVGSANSTRVRLLAGFLWGAMISLLAGNYLNPADAFLPLPLAVIGCLILLRLRKAPPIAWGFVIWSLVLLGKIVLNARIYHYGFALAMPATLLVVAVGLRYTPIPVRAALTGALLIVTIAYLSLAHRLIQEQTVSVGTFPNQFWSKPQDGQLLNSAAAFLNTHATPGDTLAVMPEGAMLNFLTKLPNSIPYWSFNPPYAFFAPFQGEAAGEIQFLTALQHNPPDWILLEQPSGDPAAPQFGRDFGQSIYDFVRTNYSTIAPVDFGIILQHRVYNAHGDTNASSPR